MVVTATTWGDPTATKRILLIHGVTYSSQFWHRLAQDFASRGYFVTAPDLLGHGCARRGSVYTIAALAEEFRPLLMTSRESGDPPYDIIVGHSLGGVVTTVLLPLLKSTRPVRVVLADPPLDVGPETLAHYRKFFTEMVGHPPGPEELLQKNPLWTKEDAVIANASMQLCGVKVVEAIYDQNVPWSFAHHLSMAPDNVQVTVLAADPSKWCIVKEEDMKAYPHVKAKTVWGASHMIPLEDPEAMLDAALGGEGKNKAGDESGVMEEIDGITFVNVHMTTVLGIP